jgi:hypothetical protein
MSQNKALDLFFSSIPASAKAGTPLYGQPDAYDIKKTFDAMSVEEKKQLLLQPLSADRPVNALSYALHDGSLADTTAGDEWRSAFVKLALDEIEKIEPDASKRIDLLTSADALGQTVFHKTLDPYKFDLLLMRLYNWAGKEAANTWMKSFIDQPPGALTAAFPYPLFNKLLYIEQAVNPKTLQQEADYVFEQLSKQDAHGDTALHAAWKTQSLQVARVFASFDKEFGGIIAVDLIKKLLLIANNKDELPFDTSLNDHNIEERNQHISTFLSTLREQLGSQDKFKTYVTEAVAAFLPPDFTVKLATYEPKLKPAKAGTSKRGAKIEP